MAIVADEIDREAPARRPIEGVAGYHCWHDLLFVHWRVEPAAVESLLPAGLSLDTYDGSAWVGIVPFSISGLRPWWFPPLPGVNVFNEINVRTYVHYRGCDPGVWFFSLDATSRLAAQMARWRWRLNYFFTRMRIRRTGDVVHYQAVRATNARKAGARIVAHIGPRLGHGEPARRLPAGQTLPGTLEHFLLDRYILYACRGDGPLYRARVHHVPYCVNEVQLMACDESLLSVAGIEVEGPPCHAAFCERADVEVFPLRPV